MGHSREKRGNSLHHCLVLLVLSLVVVVVVVMVVVVVVLMVIVCTGIGLSVLSTWQSEATMEAIVGGDSLLLYLGIVGHGGD